MSGQATTAPPGSPASGHAPAAHGTSHATPPPRGASATHGGASATHGGASATHAALVHAHAQLASAHAVTPAQSSVPHASITQEIQNWAVQWEPVIAIVFFTALILLMWRTLKVMPRVKPQRIKPASSQAVTFDDIAGVDEAKAELQEIVEFLREPKSFAKL